MQGNELDEARDAEIDTNVELGLNVDMSEFEGDKDVEAEALHDEEDEEIAQAAFELQQPDPVDNEIDSMVDGMDEDMQDPLESHAEHGVAPPEVKTGQPCRMEMLHAKHVAFDMGPTPVSQH